MTKEETKRRFQAWCQREIGNNCSNEDYAMFNNIMALLEQPSEDCISRQAVLEKLEKIEQIMEKYQYTLDNFYSGKPRDLLESDVLRDIKEVLAKE